MPPPPVSAIMTRAVGRRQPRQRVSRWETKLILIIRFLAMLLAPNHDCMLRPLLCCCCLFSHHCVTQTLCSVPASKRCKFLKLSKCWVPSDPAELPLLPRCKNVEVIKGKGCAREARTSLMVLLFLQLLISQQPGSGGFYRGATWVRCTATP